MWGVPLSRNDAGIERREDLLRIELLVDKHQFGVPVLSFY